MVFELDDFFFYCVVFFFSFLILQSILSQMDIIEGMENNNSSSGSQYKEYSNQANGVEIQNAGNIQYLKEKVDNIMTYVNKIASLEANVKTLQDQNREIMDAINQQKSDSISKENEENVV
jgi:hypothetical protein